MVTKMLEMSRRPLFQKIIQAGLEEVSKISGSLLYGEELGVGGEGGVTGNAKVPDGVVGDEIDDLVQLVALGRLFRVELVEPVQPDELDELLREEEAADEVGLRAEEGEVRVVDVWESLAEEGVRDGYQRLAAGTLHVGGAEQAVLLGGKVDDETGWSLGGV